MCVYTYIYVCAYMLSTVCCMSYIQYGVTVRCHCGFCISHPVMGISFSFWVYLYCNVELLDMFRRMGEEGMWGWGLETPFRGSSPGLLLGVFSDTLYSRSLTLTLGACTTMVDFVIT